MNRQLILLLFVLFTVNYAISEQLEGVRQSCKTEQISIPSGKTITSDSIYLKYRDNVLTDIINEECRKFNEPDRYRSKRGTATRVLKGFAEFRRATGKYARPVLKYGAKTLKYGAKGVKMGVKVATSDIGLSVIDGVLNTNWNIQNALESHEESDRNDRNDESRRLEKQIGDFTKDVNSLLYDNEIQGYIGKTLRNNKFFDRNLESKMRATDVKCIKDDFTGVYSIRLQLETDEKMTVVARRCADIGEILTDQKIYEFYEISNQFLVERNGKSFAVNSTLCSDSSPPFCPLSSLKRVTCSVMSVQNCEKRFETLDEKQKITRILPTGIVYYGSSEVLTLRRKDRTLKFSINPYNLEYIRVFEGDKIWIGNDVAYE